MSSFAGGNSAVSVAGNFFRASLSPANISKSQKIAIIAIGAGIAIAALGRYLRRRRRLPPPKTGNRPYPGWKRSRAGLRSPNGELSQTGSPGRPLGGGGSDRISVASTSSAGYPDVPIPGAELTPQQLGVMAL